MKLIEHFVGGKIIPGTSKKKGKVFNPATGEQEKEVRLASSGDLDQAGVQKIMGVESQMITNDMLLKLNDIFGIMLSIGFGLSITIYALINIGVVIGVIPVTGVPLPFISYGGSSLIINLMMIAILLNISKAQRKLNVKRWRLRVNA